MIAGAADLYGAAAGTAWSAPELAIATALFPADLAVGGFLTPTPVLRDEGTVRVFGGMRDAHGISRIGWVDVDASTRAPVAVCTAPALDTGPPGAFDANGVILGDVAAEALSGDLVLAYVGFSMFPTIKFRAYSGLATSSDGGETFTRVTSEPWLGRHHAGLPNSIIAAHSLYRDADGRWCALVAVGDGWEDIGGRPYPRYFTVAAAGPDLATMTVDPAPLLPMPDGVYRLGRPRVAPLGDGSAAIVATGGRRDGDYRAYAFGASGEGWAQLAAPPPIAPGCSPLASVQAAYPAHIVVGDEVWVFFNGDDMGRAGALLTRATRA